MSYITCAVDKCPACLVAVLSLCGMIISMAPIISMLLFFPCRKGMMMVSPAINPHACFEFEGEILVLHHPTTISAKYQAMVHCGSIRQTASIIRMSAECLRTGDKATVLFR